MKKMIVIFILSMLTSCFSSENWEIKKIKLANKEVYLKSHSWAIPERNSIILSNNNNKVFDSKIDIDFGSFVNVIFEIKDNSLFIYKPSTDEPYFSEEDNEKKFYNTKIKFVNTTLYLKMKDSLNIFPDGADLQSVQ